MTHSEPTVASDDLVPGHNAAGINLKIEVRLFNSLSPYLNKPGGRELLEVPAGTTVEDIIRRFDIPRDKIFLILVNGRDISPGLVGAIRTSYPLEEGDVLALSGPVPFSYGYGAPVV
ncbi:MAG: MoaD/ThiS family protein [Magnetovibrionaceae bacterium]